MSENIVSIKNLHVSFKSTRSKNKHIEIIRGISYDVPKGKIIGFIGESGSGKSVTAKTLLSMNVGAMTTADEIIIDGNSMIDEDGKLSTNKKLWKKVKGKKITYIPQDPMTSLNPTKKIGQQIIESLDLHSDLKTSYEKKEYAINLLERFGVKDARQRFNNYPHQFSGGMRQRVVIAVAVACKPDIIIADEPTTALDPTIQASVLSLFEEICEKEKISIIFVSHDIAVIATLCDYINVFYAGKIVERGTKKDIFTNPIHPYTWSLLAAMPDSNTDEKLFTIPGQPPQFNALPTGDPFSVRNPFALKVDFIKEPPLFKVNENHYAATWTLHPDSPEIEMPAEVKKIIKLVRKDLKNVKK